MSLKASEQRLLSLLIILLLIVVIFLAWMSLRKKHRNLKAQLQKIELQEAEVSSLQEQQEMWEERSSWLSKTAPQFQSQRESDSKLLQTTDRQAKAAGLKVIGKVLMEPGTRGSMKESGLQLKVEGEFSQLLKWLHQIQSPQQFIEVRKLTVLPKADEKGMLECSVTLIRYFQNQSKEA